MKKKKRKVKVLTHHALKPRDAALAPFQPEALGRVKLVCEVLFELIYIRK